MTENTPARKHPLAKCESCTLADEPMVPTDSPRRPKLAVVGEAPGKYEARDGKPFVGASGRLLWTVLEHNGFHRDDVLLTNACLCRPPDNRTPTKLEINCCNERLHQEIKESGATQILTLGNSASSAIFGKSTPITTLRAGPPRQSDSFPGMEIVPTIHPAACLRSGDSFPSLVNDVAKLKLDFRVKWEPPQYKVYDTEEHALRVCDDLLPYKDRLVVDIETAHDKDTAFEHPSHYDLLCIGIGYKPGRVVILERNALKLDSVRRRLGDLLRRSGITAHNGKFDVQGLRALDSRIGLKFDTMLSSYAMDERGGVHSLGYRGQEVLGTPNWKNAMKKWSNYADAPRDILNQYNAYDVATTWGLEDHDKVAFDNDNRRLMDRLVRTSNAYVPVELSGIGVDVPYLETLEEEWQGKLNHLEGELAAFVKNPRSPKQIKEALLELGVNHVESTDAAHLQEYLARTRDKNSDLAAFLEHLLNYRREQKVYGTYIAGARKRLYNGRLFPTFLLHGTTSGRLSCRNPNLFNIPRGSNLRRMFVPGHGRVFVQADYSQVEWRVVACEAQDEFLREVFSDPSRDIHSEVANRLGITRQRAKTIVYGSTYGMEAGHLGQLLNVPVNTAARVLREFFSVIPNVVAWQNSIKTKLFNEHDDLVTPYGRHRRFWLITDENKKDVYKEALSFMPQSIASDICQDAMNDLLERGFDCKLSVYDSIMLECDEADAVEYGECMREAMLEAGRAYSDYVPFDVEVKIGKSWGDFG